MKEGGARCDRTPPFKNWGQPQTPALRDSVAL